MGWLCQGDGELCGICRLFASHVAIPPLGGSWRLLVILNDGYSPPWPCGVLYGVKVGQFPRGQEGISLGLVVGNR